ncbi:hypothetical protein CFB49_10420 [Burkholderia sp. AU17457]|nr:hypothetical protein CFB49_10420 [Burkholderia sp. AU17457]
MSHAARMLGRTSAIAHIALTDPSEGRSRRTPMTRSWPRSNKAPPRAKQAMILPKLGTALNWVPPKPLSVTKSHSKKRSLAPQ